MRLINVWNWKQKWDVKWRWLASHTQICTSSTTGFNKCEQSWKCKQTRIAEVKVTNFLLGRIFKLACPLFPLHIPSQFSPSPLNQLVQQTFVVVVSWLGFPYANINFSCLFFLSFPFFLFSQLDCYCTRTKTMALNRETVGEENRYIKQWLCAPWVRAVGRMRKSFKWYGIYGANECFDVEMPEQKYFYLIGFVEEQIFPAQTTLHWMERRTPWWLSILIIIEWKTIFIIKIVLFAYLP